MARFVLTAVVTVVALEVGMVAAVLAVVLGALALVAAAALAAVVLGVAAVLVVTAAVLGMVVVPVAVLCWVVLKRLAEARRRAPVAVGVGVEPVVQVEAVPVVVAAPVSETAPVEAVPAAQVAEPVAAVETVAVPEGWGVVAMEWAADELAADPAPVKTRKPRAQRKPAPVQPPALSSLTKAQLLALAAEKGVAVASRWTKDRVIAALTAAAAA